MPSLKLSNNHRMEPTVFKQSMAEECFIIHQAK
jgi:hypothetical protein